jgi:hypothetical protein
MQLHADINGEMVFIDIYGRSAHFKSAQRLLREVSCKAKFGDDVGVDIAIVGKLDA